MQNNADGISAKIENKQTDIFRNPRDFESFFIAAIAVSWAVFQLVLAGFLVLDSTMARSIHLAFAMALLFLLSPALKRRKKLPGVLSISDRIPVIDYILAAAGAISALYLSINYENIATRAGIPNALDLTAGITLVVLLLEAARRIIGPALSVIAILFTLYAFAGQHMPDIFAFKGVSVRKYISNISLSTEGIFGIPLEVSASIVYLFVLLGALLDKAGAGRFFSNLSLSLLGRYKGGAAKAAVVSSGATGMISGSSIANIVTTGPFTIPLMKRIGYPAKKAAAIEVAASSDGQLMPPIMGAAAFIIAEYVHLPYMEVIKAAAIPAFVSYFGLFCISHLEASKLGIFGMPKEDLPDFLPTLKKGLHYLVPIAMLLYELVVMRHSPEMAAFRAIMVLFFIIVYQEIRTARQNKDDFRMAFIRAARLIIDGMVIGSRNMIAVALACAAAGIIVGVVNMGIGGMISGIVETLAMGNIFLLLLITAVASLLIGMGLPTTATYIVMAALTAPIIVQVGALYNFAIPILAAHLFCFYFGILADDTPPVGLAAYTAAAIAGSDPVQTGIQGFLYDIRTSVIAFLFVFNPELILHGINSWPHALLLFAMALIGIAAFENAVQGWCLTKNRLYEIPFFLAASFTLFYPGAVAAAIHYDQAQKYDMFFVGILIYVLIIVNQAIRRYQADRQAA